ncbi:hypothetical protein [Nocardia sp. NPDC004860]|uniref:hypothetical protein n=1 Tax=Nocardia sp. NPDC004860 TaxID=3154557 RepID=UPI0033A05743
MVIAQEALDQLLDAPSEIRLAAPAEQLRWYPSAFHRAPAALPVSFPRSPPIPPCVRKEVNAEALSARDYFGFWASLTEFRRIRDTPSFMH